MARTKSCRLSLRLSQLSWPNNIVIGKRRGIGTAAHQLARHHNNSRNHEHRSSRSGVSNPGVRNPRHFPQASRSASSRYHRRATYSTQDDTVRLDRFNTAPKPFESKAKRQSARQEKLANIDPFDVAMERYNKAYEGRLHQCRKWVNARYAEYRFDAGVHDELNAYFGKRKFGDRPSAKHLSRYACQALELSEHDLGTDLWWAKGVAWMFGPYAPYFEKIIENSMKDYGIAGPGYVGEEDLESWVGDSERWEGSVVGEADDGEVVGMNRQ